MTRARTSQPPPVGQRRSPRLRGTGSIYPTKDGRYRGFVTEGFDAGGKQIRTYFSGQTERAVQEQIDKARQQLARNQPIPDARLTVTQFLDRWLEETVRPRRERSTYEGYARIVRLHLVPELGRIRLAKLRPHEVQELLNRKLTDGASPRQVQLIQATLRAALKHAVRWELVDRNVATLVDPVTVPRPKRAALPHRDAALILDALRDDPLEALYTVALGAGLRVSEAIAITWADVDLQERLLRVTGQLERTPDGWVRKRIKTVAGQDRTAGLPEFAVESLREHKIRQRERQLRAPRWIGNQWDLLFTTGIGTPVDRHMAWRHFQELLKRAGLERMRVHDLRHGCASLWLGAGVDLKTISEMLGHSGIQITADLYAHVSDELKRQAASRIDEALGHRVKPRTETL